MAKMKSHSGAKKRFKVTGTGKVTHGTANKQHKSTCKDAGRCRSLKGTSTVTHLEAARIKRVLPNV